MPIDVPLGGIFIVKSTNMLQYFIRSSFQISGKIEERAIYLSNDGNAFSMFDLKGGDFNDPCLFLGREFAAIPKIESISYEKSYSAKGNFIVCGEQSYIGLGHSNQYGHFLFNLSTGEINIGELEGPHFCFMEWALLDVNSSAEREIFKFSLK
ncbi:hypothetical protein [Azospirillum palustre]|uniref:hypothetical protein n=1 Tax=Azospirillum palustre TaxID=2044885 RepID=UPI00137A452A|nr:hypothetical protein [Azospirillum palustre]